MQQKFLLVETCAPVARQPDLEAATIEFCAEHEDVSGSKPIEGVGTGIS